MVTAGSLLPLANTNALFENPIAELLPTGFPALTVEASNEKAMATTTNPINVYRMRRPPPGCPAERKRVSNTFADATEAGLRYRK